MIIESGFIVAFGLAFTFWKCNWKIRMWILSHPLLSDIIVFIVLNILHAGTFSGVMVAALGSLICSALISAGRFVFGFVVSRTYFPGIFNVVNRLS